FIGSGAESIEVLSEGSPVRPLVKYAIDAPTYGEERTVQNGAMLMSPQAEVVETTRASRLQCKGALPRPGGHIFVIESGLSGVGSSKGTAVVQDWLRLIF